MTQDVEDTEDVEEALRYLMLDIEAVAELIEDRIYTDVAEQGGCLPYVVLTRTSSQEEMELSKRHGAVKARIQVECFSSFRTEARKVARKIKNSNLTQTKQNAYGVDIRGIAVEDGSREYPHYPNDGSDEHLYVTSFDLEVSYLEI